VARVQRKRMDGICDRRSKPDSRGPSPRHAGCTSEFIRSGGVP
jgi:hypothetical protein